jgi:hypothetical protein
MVPPGNEVGERAVARALIRQGFFPNRNPGNAKGGNAKAGYAKNGSDRP